MNENKDLLLKMLSDEPVLYEIIKSKEYLNVLEILEKDSYNFPILKSLLDKSIDIKKDVILYNILDTLKDRDLIKKIDVNNGQMYFLTDKGKKLIKLYNQTKQEFNLM
jgi:predicted transcriptional regulator